MTLIGNPVQWFLGFMLLASSCGVILASKPVYASLSFLLTLLSLAALYLELSASFIAVMQILVYAGAILVIFMFVIVLFQDAYMEIAKQKAKSAPLLIKAAAGTLLLALIYLGIKINGTHQVKKLPEGFGTVESLGKALYLDFFFPFEAIVIIFLIALVGALYIGKKEN